METIKPEKIITTISNLKTGEVYKTEDEWKAKGVPEAEIRRDVKVIMPSLDLFPKTKQCGKMAIIRSKIARQLLAEGGVSLDDAKMMAPPGEFLAYINPKEADMLKAAGGSGIMTPMGIPSFIEYDDDFGSGFQSAKSTSSDMTGDPAQFTGGVDTVTDFTQFDTQSDDDFERQTAIASKGGPGDKSRSITDFFDSDTFNPFPIITTGLRGIDKFIGAKTNRDAYNRDRRRDFLVREGIIRSGPLGDQDLTVQGFTGDLASKAGLDFAKSKGYTTLQDQLDKDKDKSDSEPVRKLRAPITEKKEEPKKSEFDDILKFYGARFAKGGTTGDSYGEDIGAAYGTQGLSGRGNTGGDNGDDPPIVMDDGREPPMLSGGRGIDVGALERQGLTPAEIATVFSDYYGLDSLPAVTGPLGSRLGTAPSGLLAAGPGFFEQTPSGLLGLGTQETKGTKGTEGTKGTTGLGFAFTPEAPIAIDKVFGSGLRDRTKMYEDVFKADGGVIRQEYGLGSIVKKIGKTVKKVVKSPLGKAALTFAAYKYGPGFLSGKGLGMGKATSFKDLIFMGKDANVNPFRLIGIPTLLSGLLTKDPKDETILSDEEQSDPAVARTLEFYGGPRRFASKGGDIDKEPKNYEKDAEYKGWKKMYEKNPDVGAMHPKHSEYLNFYNAQKKAEGGIMGQEDEMLDLGGNEMDLRGGGFVPLGEYEKKDDVPARLSKNEFVFTADAVRAAGGGSVDKGADVMYKTMKTLENKVA